MFFLFISLLCGTVLKYLRNASLAVFSEVIFSITCSMSVCSVVSFMILLSRSDALHCPRGTGVYIPFWRAMLAVGITSYLPILHRRSLKFPCPVSIWGMQKLRTPSDLLVHFYAGGCNGGLFFLTKIGFRYICGNIMPFIFRCSFLFDLWCSQCPIYYWKYLMTWHKMACWMWKIHYGTVFLCTSQIIL